MSKLTAAYIAGYIDGEGYLGIMERHKDSKYHCRSDYLPVIKIASVDKDIIEWFKSSFGGWIHQRKFKDNSKDAYSWTLAGKKIKPFLDKIYPYLKIKKEQADLLKERIKMYDRIKIENGAKNIYRDSDFEKLKDLYSQIRKLNKRGKN